MTRIAVVANQRCGPERAPTDLAAIESSFRACGAADVQMLAVPGDRLEAAAAECVRGGADVLVAAGGDGTTNALASVACRTGTRLALLPIGTLNHFAKDAGLPLDLDEAVRVAAHGRTRPVDTADVNGHLVLNNASVGLYPRAVVERERLRRQGHSRPAAYLGAAAALLRRLPAHHLRLRIDGQSAETVTSFLMVGNNAYGTAPGELGHRRSLRGGRLWVYTMRRPGRRAVLSLAARAIAGRLEQARDLQVHTARTLEVASARNSLRVGIDGEVRRLATPLRFRIHPRALRLQVPP